MVIAGILLTATVFSCSSGMETTHARSATELYNNSVKLIKNYTDSLLLARDSVRVNTLADNLNEELTTLNFKYSPNSDILLSEGENDTLAYMVEKFVKLKNEQLYGFAHPIVRSDSLSSDTLDTVDHPTLNPDS